MMYALTRREFARTIAAAGAALALSRSRNAWAEPITLSASKTPLFEISLAQWSLHRAFGRRGKATMDPLDFARISHTEFDINAVEYVSQFYKDKKNDDGYLKQLKEVADNHGVRSVLIMVDNEGALGDADTAKRKQAVDQHKRWVEWAKFLGCHSVRVNAYSTGTYEEQLERAADGLAMLTDFAAPMGISIIVENHGGLSSNGAWLAAVMKKVGKPTCGTLPDFGNFKLGMKDGKEEWYDRYQGVDEMMPFAKGVSAKSHEFDDKGNEVRTDYRKMLEIVVKKHKYNSFIGIEYEGDKHTEAEGIRLTKQLLETVRTELANA